VNRSTASGSSVIGGTGSSDTVQLPPTAIGRSPRTSRRASYVFDVALIVIVLGLAGGIIQAVRRRRYRRSFQV